MNHNVNVMTSSVDMDFATPQEFVDSLPFNFDVDVCATRGNAKARHWIEPSTDALQCDWRYSVGQTCCWMNPPYGKAENACEPNCQKKVCQKRGHHLTKPNPGVEGWIEKAYAESLNRCTVVCLVPNRTETHWFNRIWKNATLICFVGSRIAFEHPDPKKAQDGAPFANVIAVFGDLENPIGIAAEMSRHGTTILPGAGNIWLHGSKG